MTVSALAADLPVERALGPYFIAPNPIAQWAIEIGGRYWFSSGRTQLDLFGFTQSDGFLSRLTYTGLNAQTGEVFGRVEHVSGFLVKGFAGGGAITNGNLRDEDFFPFTDPYSSTNSEQRDGRLAYATIDFGWTWRSEGIKFGFFIGYHFYHEQVNAFGCTQNASNAFICAPSIPGSVLTITQETDWHAMRLGLNTEWWFAPGWRLSVDAAWIPWASLVASDTHWLRIPADFSGSIPERGDSFLNVQLEAFVSYQFLNGFSLGVGGRYWNFSTTSGQAHFESSAVNGFPQQISLATQRWGGFLQASYRFGVLRPTRYN